MRTLEKARIRNEKTRLRNAKSTISRNNDMNQVHNSEHNKSVISNYVRSRLCDDHSESIIPQYSVFNAKNNSSISHLNLLPYSSFENEFTPDVNSRRQKLKKLTFLNKKNTSDSHIYVNEQYEEVEVPPEFNQRYVCLKSNINYSLNESLNQSKS